MEGPRPLFDHELGEFVDFLTKELRPNEKWTIADEYPVAIADANLNNVRVIKDQTNFVSAAVMKPLVIKSQAGLFKVAAIGSVVTATEHRNQGLSRQVLEECLTGAQKHGCDFAILWTDLFDFYRKLGFELAGTEVSLEIPATFTAGAASDLKFIDGPKIDPEAVLRLYSQHTTGAVRTVDEVRRFLQIPNSRVYSAWDSLGRLQAYLIEGKGADLNGYIHEWGGGVSKLIPLIQHAIKSQGRGLTLITPPNSVNLIRQLKEAGAQEHFGVLGMIKLLNASNVLTKLKKYLRSTGIEDLVLEARDGKFYFGYKEELFHTDSEADLIRLIFGPQKASQIHSFDKETSDVFEQIFPIPMWIWGWDSV